MIDNKDFDFVKEKFDGDGIETPEKLSADNMMKMLDAQPERAASQREQRPIRKRPWFRPVVAAAACAETRNVWNYIVDVKDDNTGTIIGPKVMFGTKLPSMTSKCIHSTLSFSAFSSSMKCS